MRRTKPFGYQLMLDLYGCNHGVCDDMDLCYDFLSELVGFIGMHKQSEPTVVRTDHRRFPDKKGLSGWVALVESGIQIHTLSLKNFITIDVYSCRKFSRKKVVKFVRRYFGPQNMDEQFVFRGRKYFS
ncbi:MAG: S-adenosylmethionine decarboxylase [Candidatus Harrisonbacteria bacterium]|nr:S-adenosylmethionine decarboxylase [Candidatus Harrisonbacteria bacterium]